MAALTLLAPGCGSGGGSGVIVSPATTPPAVISVEPPPGAAAGPSDALVVRFDRALAPSSVGAGDVAVSAQGAPVAGVVSLQGDRAVVFTPAVALPLGATISAEVGTEVASAFGVPLAAPETFTVPTAATLTALSDPRLARTSMASVALADGRLLVAGGRDAAGPTASCVIVDVALGTVTPTGALAAPRQNHQAVLLDDGRVAVVGGQTATTVHTTIEVWSPVTGAWTAGASGVLPRSVGHRLHRIQGDAQRRWVLVGGGSTTNPGNGNQRAVEVLSSDLSSVLLVSATQTALYGPSVQLTNGDVVIVGREPLGVSSNASSAKAEVVRLQAGAVDPVVDATLLAGALASGPESDPGACRLPGDDRILTHSATRTSVFSITRDGAGVPTGVASVAGPVLPLARSRTFTQVLPAPDGSLVIGPGGNGSAANGAVDLYVPGAAGTAGTLVPLSLEPRRSYGMDLLRDGRVVLLGGRIGGLSAGAPVERMETLSHERLAARALETGARFVAIGVAPRSGLGIAITDRAFTFTLAAGVDAASVTATAAVIRVNGIALATALVTRPSRRQVSVALPASETLIVGNAVEVELTTALRDTAGRPLDVTRGVSRASWRVVR